MVTTTLAYTVLICNEYSEQCVNKYDVQLFLPTTPHLILYILFIAKPVVDRIRSLRLSLDDFETLEVIGRGAFGEVKVGIQR